MYVPAHNLRNKKKLQGCCYSLVIEGLKGTLKYDGEPPWPMWISEFLGNLEHPNVCGIKRCMHRCVCCMQSRGEKSYLQACGGLRLTSVRAVRLSNAYSVSGTDVAFLTDLSTGKSEFGYSMQCPTTVVNMWAILSTSNKTNPTEILFCAHLVDQHHVLWKQGG